MGNAINTILYDINLANESLKTLLILGDTDNSIEVSTIVQESITSEKESIVDTIKRILANVYKRITQLIEKGMNAFKELGIFISGKERIIRETYQQTRGEQATARDKLRRAILDSDLSKGLVGLVSGKPNLVLKNGVYVLKTVSDNSIKLFPISMNINPSYVKNNGITPAYIKEMTVLLSSLSQVIDDYSRIAKGLNEILTEKENLIKMVLAGKEVDKERYTTKIIRINDSVISKLNKSTIHMENDEPLHARSVMKLDPSEFLKETSNQFVEKTIDVILNQSNLHRVNKDLEKSIQSFRTRQTNIINLVSKASEETTKSLAKYLMLDEKTMFLLLEEYRAHISKVSRQSLELSMGILRERGRVYVEILRYLDRRNTKYR